MRNPLLAVALLIGLIAACSGGSSSTPPAALPGSLALDATGSTIHFVGIKNNAVAVPGTFSGLSGTLDLAGRKATVRVPIASLATGDEERDLNIETHVFAAADHPTATFSVDGVQGLSSLPRPGESAELTAKAVLDLRGKKIALDAPVRLTHVAGGAVRVTSTKPIVLIAEELGLQPAFGILKAVCGHAALSQAVPVEVDLLFR